MSEAIPLFPLYAFMVRAATSLPFLGPIETQGSLKDASSGMLHLINRTTRCHMPEELIFRHHRC